MVRIVMLADLHGNFTAAEAMERELDRLAPDQVWFLGDAVGKGPQSAETCDWVRKNCTRFIGGNWDYWLADNDNRFKSNDFFRRQLGAERLAWLAALPHELDVTVSGVHFRVFHGRPAADLIQGWDSEEYMKPFFTAGGVTYGGIICGDSHRPFVRSTEWGYAINTGSIGNSLGVPNVHALLLEGEQDEPSPAPLRMTILSVPYDNKAAAEIAHRTEGLPDKEAYINEILTGVYSR